jgi:hypothetical protein
MLRTKDLFRALISVILTVSFLRAASPTVGDRAPDFQLTTVDGHTLRLSDAISNGPVALLVLRGYPGYQRPGRDGVFWPVARLGKARRLIPRRS